MTVEGRVIMEIMERAKAGKSKYGTTMERDDLSIHEWLQHAKEEAMDLAIYLTKLQREIQTEKEEDIINYDESDSEERMANIGRNGNDGDHYKYYDDGSPRPQIHWNKTYTEDMMEKSEELKQIKKRK